MKQTVTLRSVKMNVKESVLVINHPTERFYMNINGWSTCVTPIFCKENTIQGYDVVSISDGKIQKIHIKLDEFETTNLKSKVGSDLRIVIIQIIGYNDVVNWRFTEKEFLNISNKCLSSIFNGVAECEIKIKQQ